MENVRFLDRYLPAGPRADWLHGAGEELTLANKTLDGWCISCLYINIDTYMWIFIYTCVYIYIHTCFRFFSLTVITRVWLAWFSQDLFWCDFSGDTFWQSVFLQAQVGVRGFTAADAEKDRTVSWLSNPGAEVVQEAAEMPGYRRFAILIGSWLTVKVKLPMYWHNDSLFKLNDLKNCTESMLTEFQAVNGCAIWTADRMAECHGLRLFGGWLDELLHVQNMAMSMPCLRSWPSKLIDFLVVCRMTVCNFISRRLLGIPALFF